MSTHWVKTADENRVSPDSVKLGLFVKNNQAQKLITEFERIRLLPTPQRQAWLDENESVLNHLLDTFAQDSLVALDGLGMDEETVSLSIELVTNLRDAMNTIQGVLYDDGRLKS